MLLRIVLTVWVTFLSSLVYSQQIKPQGVFLRDSIKVGEVIPFSFWAKYPYELTVVFPDSGFNYYPFEFVSKAYFPTKTNSGISLDSVVYYLTTFEIEHELGLSLPVFVVQNGDSTPIFSDSVWVYFNSALPPTLDSLSVISNVDFIDVPLAFNHIRFFIIIGVVVLVLVVLFIFFGNKLRRQVQIFFMIRGFKRFEKRFQNGLEANMQLSELCSVWKKYLEKMEKHPFTKMTSKEIYKYFSSPDLKQMLQEIDKVIYGGFDRNELDIDLARLCDFAKERFEMKIDQLKYA